MSDYVDPYALLIGRDEKLLSAIQQALKTPPFYWDATVVGKDMQAVAACHQAGDVGRPIHFAAVILQLMGPCAVGKGNDDEILELVKDSWPYAPVLGLWTLNYLDPVELGRFVDYNAKGSLLIRRRFADHLTVDEVMEWVRKISS